MKQVAIGIDIGGTNTVIGIVDKEGQVLSQVSIPTKTHSDYTIYLDALAGAVQELLAPFDGQLEVLGVGLGAPNGNYYNGTIEFAPNLNFKGIVPVVGYLQEKLGMKEIILTS